MLLCVPIPYVKAISIFFLIIFVVIFISTFERNDRTEKNYAFAFHMNDDVYTY